jgi:hypothetical protein
MLPSATTCYMQHGTVSLDDDSWPTIGARVGPLIKPSCSLTALRSPKSYLTSAHLDVEATPQTLALVQATTL